MEGKRRYKAVLYARVSKEETDCGEGGSIVNQLMLMKRYVASKEDIEIVSEREDDGYSGTNFNRPAFQKMIGEIRSGRVNCVIVKDLSRFGRNYVDAGRFLDVFFPSMGVRFIAVTDGYDSLHAPKDEKQLLVPVKNIINELYSADIALKTRGALAALRKSGAYVSAFAPYGYQKDAYDRHRLVPDETAACIVSDIFRYSLYGYSNREIADSLNRKGIACPMEYKILQGRYINCNLKRGGIALWREQTVLSILKNAVYTGMLVQGKTTSYSYRRYGRMKRENADTVKGTHEKVIPDLVFQTANKAMKAKAGGGEDGFCTAGLLRCGLCGERMIVTKTRHVSKEYTYFICGGRKYRRSCPMGRVSGQKAEKALFRFFELWFGALICGKDSLKWLPPLDNIGSHQKASELVMLQRALGRQKIHRKALQENYNNGVVDKEAFEGAVKELEEQKRFIKRRIEAIRRENNFEEKGPQAGGMELFFLHRGTAEVFVDDILCFKRNCMVIRLSFQDCLLGLGEGNGGQK